MKNDKATPRPWRKSEGRAGSICISSEFDEDAKTEDVCKMQNDRELKAHHNANLIICAVNSHAALTEAAEFAATQLGVFLSTDAISVDDLQSAWEKLQQALAIASGKK